MKILPFATLFANIAFGSIIQDDWVSFKLLHGKSYSSLEEEQFRRKVYLENKQLVDEHNRLHSLGQTTFSMKMNHLGDMTDDEFAGVYLSPLMNVSMEAGASDSVDSEPEVQLPYEVDWRLTGGLTPVKTQGSCGACWAFSSTGAIEAQLYNRTGRLVQLSEQNLLDCSSFNRYGNSGCEGGLMNFAFRYVMENGGVDTEDSYPYEGELKTCRFKTSKVGATIKGYKSIHPGNERQLKKVVARIGPVSVGLEASSKAFRFYNGGIFYHEGCGKSGVNHAALVVGYGTKRGRKYWLVKNSWGTKWGEKGYFKMVRNKNHCGIASLASYPLL